LIDITGQDVRPDGELPEMYQEGMGLNRSDSPSSDTERVGTSREEFHAILQEEELKDALLLVYANKQVSALPISGCDVQVQ